MFMTSTGASIIIAVQFCAGALIGALIAALPTRRKLTLHLVLATALVTGIALNLAIGLIGWAGWHQGPKWSDGTAAHPAIVISIITVGAAVATIVVMEKIRKKRKEVA